MSEENKTEPHKFTKPDGKKGRPPFEMPCSTCGVKYKDHPKVKAGSKPKKEKKPKATETPEPKAEPETVSCVKCDDSFERHPSSEVKKCGACVRDAGNEGVLEVLRKDKAENPEAPSPVIHSFDD